MMSHSPTDQMFERMDQSAYATVPRYLVDELIEAREKGEPTTHLERQIAEAAIDDVS